MKLISMTEFVLEIQSPNNYLKALSSITSYANLLKTPLTLGMFIPCDEEGKLLEYPKDHTFFANKKAEERVLFEGFSLSYSELESDYILTNKKGSSFNSGALFRLYETIEDLTQYDLTLTQNAVKKFKI